MKGCNRKIRARLKITRIKDADTVGTRENASFRRRKAEREDRSTKIFHFRWRAAEGHPTGFLSCGRNKILVNRLDSAVTRKFYSLLSLRCARWLSHGTLRLSDCHSRNYRRQPADRITLILKYCSLDGVRTTTTSRRFPAKGQCRGARTRRGIRRSNAPLMRIHSLRGAINFVYSRPRH